MRRLELNILDKLKKDFPSEIELLEHGLNTIVKCDQLLQQTSPLLNKPDLRNNLLNSNQQDRCYTTHTLLISHSITFLKAARLLLLTGYIAPSLSCLRTAFESFQNAHICSVSDDQAISLLKGKHLNKKLDTNYPIQLDETTGKEIKRTLAYYGVHANYEAIETQALYEGSIFIEENRATYEFILLRNIYSFLTIILLLLDYLLDKQTFLVKELPDAMSLAKTIGRNIQEIGVKLAKLSK
ncbi:hypothetical protein ACFLRP_05175 [Bacteroidota bacterium]